MLNSFFESWCSANNGPCSNFVANNSAPCDTSRCASVECLIPTPSSPSGSILQFVNNLPNFLWYDTTRHDTTPHTHRTDTTKTICLRMW